MEMEQEKRVGEYVSAAGLRHGHGNSSALNSESDLQDHNDVHLDDSHDSDGQNHVDYSLFTKQQLVDRVRDLVKDNDFKKIEYAIRDIKTSFEELRARERTTALNRFILDGGTADGFDYKGDELDLSFDNALKQIKEKKHQFLKNQEDQKNENLRKKLELLEKLRELVDSQDTANQFDQFKELQRAWKATGQVPGVQAKSVWANYHALVDRFYDNQSIYFELKELDRKKNLEAKVELCVRAEKLAEAEKIKEAIRELNELHHEFKHIGPVPIEDKENVWQRFKAASDAIYARRDAYLKDLQQELTNNLESKKKLGDEAEGFASFQSDRIKDWNQKTKEILELQKKWEAVGGVPRTKAKEVNKKFWSSFKTFFNNKSIFFKKLDEEREENLKKKNELVQKALELKGSSDWEKTSNELKNLQQKWKEIGPVPEKFREKIFKEFKEACDYFFEQRRGQQGKVEHEQLENLKIKETICLELEKGAAEKSATPELLRELETKFNSVGFVPKRDITVIRNRYFEAVEKFVKSMEGVSDDDRSKLMLENQLMDLKNDPMADRKIFQKEQAIRKKIQKVENDISLWKNNLEFFARSQNADKVRDEFNDKINIASDHLKQLKQQLKMLRAVSSE